MNAKWNPYNESLQGTEHDKLAMSKVLGHLQNNFEVKEVSGLSKMMDDEFSKIKVEQIDE